MNLLIEHLGLAARNAAALKDWYVKILDAKVVFDNGETPPSLIIALAGGSMIEIYPGNFGVKETSNNKLNGWRHVALRVNSIEAAKAHLEKRGVKFTEPVRPAVGGGRVLFFEDCEGNLLHFIERAPDSPVP